MPVFGLKMPDLRVNKQTGEVGHNLQKPASRDDSDAFDLSVVIADEPEVRSECPEGPPARKRLRVDHQSCNISFPFDAMNVSISFVNRSKSDFSSRPSGVIIRMFRSRSCSK